MSEVICSGREGPSKNKENSTQKKIITFCNVISWPALTSRTF